MAKDDKTSPAAEIQDVFTSGKKRALNFAMMKSKEGVVLKAHPTKGSAVMYREAKAAGGMPSVAITGVLNVIGKQLELSVETPDVPRNLPKLAKRYFSSLGILCKVVIILPGGEQVGDEDEADSGAVDDGKTEAVAPSLEAPVAPPPQDDSTAIKDALTQRIKALVPQVKAALAVHGAAVEKLAKGLQAAGAHIAAGGFDQAKGLVDAVEKGLQQLPQPVDESALRAQYEAEFKGFEPGLMRLANEGNKAVSGKAAQIAGMFAIELDRDLKKTGQILALLKNFIATELAKLEAAPPVTDADGAEAKGAPEQDAGFFGKVKEFVTGKKDASDGSEGAARPPAATMSAIERIETAIKDGISDVVAYLKDKADLIHMATAYPEAALAAHAAIAAFDETLGSDLTITPEVLAKAASDTALAHTTVDAAKTALATAAAMKKGGTRNKAIKAAQKALAEAEAAQAKAVAFENAAKGKNLLETEMTVGGLSPESPNRLTGEAALALVKGATRDPDLTATAFSAARDGAFPNDVAMNLGKVIDLKASGFAHEGKAFRADASAGYADSLLKMGGNVGPGYFARMDDYMTSGRQFLTDPTHDLPASDFAELEQNRTVTVGKALVGAGGKVDVTSQGAKDAVGDALFNRSALRNARPALTANILETVEFLAVPSNGEKATEIMQAVPEPTDPSAIGLVRNAVRKGPTDAIGKSDVQSSVMASMLKSIDQGPVGSCFATAPARRLRETKPLDAMAAYAQIAGTGKYKPPFGPEVPIVTNIAPGDDPVLRSFEYSLATSTAQRAGSDRKRAAGTANGAGLATLNAAISAGKLADMGLLSPDEQAAKMAAENTAAPIRLAKLKADVAAAFTFFYDPLDVIGVGADGSSDRGRYILKQINPATEIRTKQTFIDAMTGVALASLGIAADAPEATPIKDHVKSDAFINAIVQVYGTDADSAYLPWALSGGGQTGEATQTLHGDTLTQQSMTAKAGPPLPDEGQRTTDVLLGFLGGMQGKTGEMVTVRTVGMHGFNAMPNNSSLAPLRGDTPEARAKNVDEHLIQPGLALRDKKVAANKVLDMFTKEIQPLIDAEADPALKALLQAGFDTHKPTAAMTPPELDKAIRDAVGPANAKRAEAAADAWKAGETAPVTPQALAAKRAELGKKYDDSAADSMTTRMMKDFGPPEFVIADSNWGSGADHTFFVIAPDPVTGAPLLWTKTTPPGSLRKAGREWVDHEWAMID